MSIYPCYISLPILDIKFSVQLLYKPINSKTNPERLNELISLRVPKVNITCFGLNSWRYQAPKTWNSLPDVIRASSDFKTFKKLLENESLF